MIVFRGLASIYHTLDKMGSSGRDEDPIEKTNLKTDEVFIQEHLQPRYGEQKLGNIHSRQVMWCRNVATMC